jgi:enterochelin esterase-like enzyme
MRHPKDRLYGGSVKRWWLLVIGLALALPCLGRALETIHSERLHRDVPVALHVPAPAVVRQWTAHHSAPMTLVLFLPGAYDGPEDFQREDLEAFLADQEARGELPPSLWVVVTHFRSWYADRPDGSFPFERFLMDELIPLLEARYPGFGGSPQARAVTGLSMGGFGALNLAARTGAFSHCLALSPALVEAPFQGLSWFVRRSLVKAFPRDPAAFAPWNPWKHLGGSAELIVGCGTEDDHGLAEACRTFARICAERHRPMRLELSPGGHDWSYWTPTFKRWAAWLAGQKEGSPTARAASPPP